MSLVINLSKLGFGGFVIAGGHKGDLAGSSVASAGDLNGDGYADLIVGAPRADSSRLHTGKAYVVFGKAEGFATIDLNRLGPADGFSITGQAATLKMGLAGASVSSAGDFNNDGFDDFLVGAPGYGEDAGAAYLIYGKAAGFGNLSLDRLDVSDGFRMVGGLLDLAGTSVSAAGDVNGDGYADVIVGSPGDNGADGFRSGQAYVLFGTADGYESIDLDQFPTASGFVIRGDTFGDEAGFSVSSAGDVNGDGFADVVVGAPGGDDGGVGAGEAYVLFGKSGGFGQDGLIDLTNLSASDGFAVTGAAAFDEAGQSVSSAGDINADGYADLIVGAPGNDAAGLGAGAAYVIFGKADGFAPVNLGSLALPDGFVILGDAQLDQAGWSVAAAGDVNGDGFADVVLGARRSDIGGVAAGAAYVIYGKAAGFGPVDLTDLAATDGFVIQGDGGGDNAGTSVAGAGDVNGDGFADLIVGAPYGDDLGKNAGNAYVVFGFAPDGNLKRSGTEIANTIRGADGNDTLSGLGGDDVLIGGGGNDSLQGQGGDDDLQGGDGNDKLAGSVGGDLLAGGAGDDWMVGGSGKDVLVGGEGRDELSGGDGADLFRVSLGDTAADAANADRILDFSQAGRDRIYPPVSSAT